MPWGLGNGWEDGGSRAVGRDGLGGVAGRGGWKGRGCGGRVWSGAWPKWTENGLEAWPMRVGGVAWGARRQRRGRDSAARFL